MDLLDLAVKIGVQDEASSKLDAISAGAIAKGVVVGQAMWSAMSTAASAVASAVGSVVSGSVEAYSAYEQNLGGIQKIFGNMGQSLEEYAASTGQTVDECSGKWQSLENAQSTMLANADQAWQTAGLSASSYMEQATSFGAALVSSLGGDTEKAVAYANTALVDMSDNANTFGTNITDIQNAYQGFAKQNYTMLDNLKLGYGGTQSEMQRLIQDAAAVSDSVDADSMSFDNCVQAIHVMQEQMNVAGTTSREAASTIEGSVNSLSAAWENWLTGLGNSDADMGALSDNLANAFTAAAENVVPRVGLIVGTLIAEVPEMVATLGPTLAATVSGIADEAFGALYSKLPAELQGVADAALGVADAVRSAFEALPGAFDAVVSAVGGAIGSVVSAVSPLATYFAAQMLPAVVSFASGLVSAFSAVWPVLSQFGQTVQDIGGAVLPVLQNAFALVLPLVGQAISLVTQLASALSPLVSQVSAALMPALTAIGTALANLAGAALPGLAAAVQIVFSVLQALMPVIETVLSVVGSVLSVVITVTSQVVAAVTNAAAVVASLLSATLTAVSAFVAAVSAFVASVLAVVGGCVSTVAALVSDAVNTVVALIGSLVSGVLAAISGMVSGIASYFQSAVSTMANAASGAYSAVVGAFNSMVGGVSGAVGGVMGVVSGIPGRILSALGNTGSLLFGAGSAIINGLLNGLRSAIGSVYSFVSGIAGTIASLKGPLPYDRRLLIPNGQAIMQSLYAGLEGGYGDVLGLVSGMADGIAGGLGEVAATVTLAPVAQVESAQAVAASQSGAVIDWLEANLGDVIAARTPYTGMRDFDRLARRAVARA